MPLFTVDDCDLYLRQKGEGDEFIVFSHGLFLDLRQFNDQLEELSEDYRCIAYDHRGHGRSNPSDAPMVDMERLYYDVSAMINAVDPDRCHFVGASTMGGSVGLRLAARRPALIDSLTLIGATARPDPPKTADPLSSFASIASTLGVGVVAARKITKGLMPRLFGEAFLESEQRKPDRDLWWKHMRHLDRDVVKSIRGVLHRIDVSPELPAISVPTLVLHGELDRMVSSQEAVQLERLIPRARLHNIAGAGNTPTVEQPEAVTERLKSFLDSVP